MTQNDSKCLLIAYQKPRLVLCVFSCATITQSLCCVQKDRDAACSVSLQLPGLCSQHTVEKQPAPLV